LASTNYNNNHSVNIPIPEWDPELDGLVSDEDKKAAESAYRDFLSNPEKYAEYYLNPESAAEEYFYLELFVQYSVLNKYYYSADDIIWVAIAEKYGQSTAENLADAQLLTIQNNLVGSVDINDAIEPVIAISVIDILMPKGTPLGKPGLNKGVQELATESQLMEVWSALKANGIPSSMGNFEGEVYLLNNGGKVGLNLSGKGYGPTIRIWNMPDVPFNKIHLPITSRGK
jgi:hypothetical protein